MERKDVVDEDRLELYKNDLTNLMFHQNDHVYEWKLQGGQKLITVLNKKTSEKIKEFLGKDKKKQIIALEILEDDEYYDIGTSSIIDLSSEFKGGMYSWFEKDWGNLKKRFMKLLT
ncbi:hypothetical protein RhiirA1_463236 [Rhizophagus irregularis]|uniref:Uncharacterized protein n=1 Tax=Rhizophagus irregularis TaxID=588596 RepID=A0A2I1EA14_9GLOM|nr:hypothetical protein RhiirA1_463236 [Rhizophagus irregularis]PKY18975.1 hypothetical protein RhiirB3_431894 [Rhizophagus irregularis]